MNGTEYRTILDALNTIIGNQEKILTNQSAMMQMLRRVSDNGGAAKSDEAIADDADLDGQHGDPTIKYDLREKYWQGEPYSGQRFSECPPEYLDAMAKYLSACAWGKRKDGDEKAAGYKDKDAARARGWARRIRNGWKPPASHGYRPPQGAQGGGFGSGSTYRSSSYGKTPRSPSQAQGGYVAGSYGNQGAFERGPETTKDEFGGYGGSDDDIPF